MALGYLRPLESRGCRHLVVRTHIGADYPAHLGRRIGGRVDLVAELLGLVHLIDAIAVDVEFPAVIDAAQARFLVASEPQRGTAGRAELVDQTETALAVAKAAQTLTQKLNTNRRAVRLRKLAREKRRDPVAPQHVTHRGPWSRPRHQLIVFARQHYSTSSSCRRRRTGSDAPKPDCDHPPIGRVPQEAREAAPAHRLCLSLAQRLHAQDHRDLRAAKKPYC